ncbi:MAG: hypothetical protein JW772_01265 [Candidatus Diapherotrites archaeon]|nr:hypothetical protein [Candidatus Diapherotrites archaeon]
MNVFRMFVFAIVTLALIWALYTFLPVFFPTEDPAEVIENTLVGAEIEQGKAIEKAIFFPAGHVLVAENFDASNRSLAFECNNPKECCNINDKCGLIEWDERRIIFPSTKNLRTYTRCALESNLFVCKVYFGDEPAQLMIRELVAKEKYDASKEPVVIKVKIENSGKQIMLFGSVKIDVYQKKLENGAWRRIFLFDASKSMPLDRLLSREITTMEIPIDVGSGNFEVKIKALGEDSGFDMNTVIFEVVGGEVCRAQYCEQPNIDLATGECKTLCHCIDCLLGSVCEEKLEAKSPADLWLPDNINLRQSPSNFLGSNQVEFVLDQSHCR